MCAKQAACPTAEPTSSAPRRERRPAQGGAAAAQRGQAGQVGTQRKRMCSAADTSAGGETCAPPASAAHPASLRASEKRPPPGPAALPLEPSPCQPAPAHATPRLTSGGSRRTHLSICRKQQVPAEQQAKPPGAEQQPLLQRAGGRVESGVRSGARRPQWPATNPRSRAPAARSPSSSGSSSRGVDRSSSSS